MMRHRTISHHRPISLSECVCKWYVVCILVWWNSRPLLQNIVSFIGLFCRRYLQLVATPQIIGILSKETPPLGGGSIYYVPWSRAVCKRVHDEMRRSHLIVKSLTHGSWSGNHSTKKPPPWGGFPAINFAPIHVLHYEVNLHWGLVPCVDYLPGFPYLVHWLLTRVGGHY